MSADDDGRHRYSDQRVSDAEREQIVQLLNQAMVEGRITLDEFDERSATAYAARYRSDFLPLTSDLLPVPLGEQDPVPTWDATASQLAARSGSGVPARVDGIAGPGNSLALMGGVDRNGQWNLSRSHTAVAVMGGIVLDLREARLESKISDITATAFWGGIEIVAPPDIRVEVDGTGIMGGYGNRTDSSAKSAPPPPPDAPLIRVHGFALMGGVEVVRKA